MKPERERERESSKESGDPGALVDYDNKTKLCDTYQLYSAVLLHTREVLTEIIITDSAAVAMVTTIR